MCAPGAVAQVDLVGEPDPLLDLQRQHGLDLVVGVRDWVVHLHHHHRGGIHSCQRALPNHLGENLVDF